jgi:acyl dehydratase
LFGFKKPIAHGMYSIAKAQALLEDRMGKKICELSADFIKPALLPGQVALEATGKSFRLLCNSQVIVTGFFELAVRV